MLEVPLSTDIVNQCLTSPNVKIVHSNKKVLLKRDYDILISTAMMHPSVEPTLLRLHQFMSHGERSGMVPWTME